MKNYKNRSISNMHHKQQGFVTLVASLMLMFLITFNVFMGAKGSIVEQQTATNMYASDIAFNRAEEGIAAMIAKINAGKNTDPITILDKYQVTYNLFTDPKTNITTGTIVSVGKGAMGAERAVTQRLIVGNSGMLDHNAASLNTLGNADISGSMTITSINAGGNSVKVNNGATVGSSTTNSADFQVKVVDASGAIITDSLGNALTRLMTPGEQFMFYYGTNFCPEAKAGNAPENCIAEAKVLVASSKNKNGTAKGYVCTNNCGNDFDTKYAAGIRYFWVTNGMTINANTIVGEDADPVFIFNMDNSSIKINGTAKIFGYLYVYVPATTTPCNCEGKASVVSITKSYNQIPIYGNDLSRPIMGDDKSHPKYGPDTTKPIYAQVDDLNSPDTFESWSYSFYTINGVKSGNKYANICYGTGKQKNCSQSIKDKWGESLIVSISDGAFLIDDSTVAHPVLTYKKKNSDIIGYTQKITGYEQIITGYVQVVTGYTNGTNYGISAATWSSPITYSLAATQPNATSASVCKASVCAAAVTTNSSLCTFAVNNSLVQGFTSTCSFVVPAATIYGSGPQATPVVIEILGDYDMSGTGNALIQGALITSGNVSGQGHGKLLGGGNGGGAGSGSATKIDPHGWSDML